MDRTLPALADAWIDHKRTRTRRGLSVASETAYHSDLAQVARRLADQLGRPDPDEAASTTTDEARDGTTDGAAGTRPAAWERHLARLGLEDLTAEHLGATFARLVADGYAAATAGAGGSTRVTRERRISAFQSGNRENSLIFV